MKIDRREDSGETRQSHEDGYRRNDSPSRYLALGTGFVFGFGIHGWRSDSLAVPHSSSQKSAFGFHSGFSRPEICSSDSFKVPWPYGQMYSIRGRPSSSIRLH